MKIKSNIDDAVRRTKGMAKGIEGDITNLMDRYARKADALLLEGEDRLGQVMDMMEKNRYGLEFLKTAYEKSKDGRESVIEGLKEKRALYDSKLDELAMDKPHVAGAIDGFVNSYLGTDTNRRPKSKRYKEHVKYGQVLGWGSSTVLFMNGKIFLGTIPYLSRAARYMKNKFDESA